MRIALDIPPGLVSDDTTFASSGRYQDSNNMRPSRGRMGSRPKWTATFQPSARKSGRLGNTPSQFRGATA